MPPLRHTRLGSPLGQGAIAFFSGIAMALSVEPFAAWPLAWVAIAPLWVLVMGHRSYQFFLRRALGLGAAWSIGYYGLMLSWVTGLHPLTWMGVPWLASVAIALFCWGAGTLYCTAWTLLWLGTFRGVAAIQARLRRRSSFSSQSSQGHGYFFSGSPLARMLWESSQRVLLGAALWGGMDWLWRHSFLYWPSLALTQSPHNLVILHLTQWAGPDAVAIAIIAVNGFLAEAWIAWRSASVQSSIAFPLAQRTATCCGAIALGLFIGFHGLGAMQFRFEFFVDNLGEELTPASPVDSASSAQESLSIGMIQGNVPTRIKLYKEGLRRAFQGYTEGYETLVDQGVDAVLTPEGAFPIIWDDPIQTRTPLYRAVRDRHVPLWLGTFFPEGRDFTQSLISLDQDAEVVGRYSKVKLVPFGEYIPFEPILGAIVDRLSPLDAYMIPGQTGQRFDTPFGQAIVGICYESAFSQIFRQQARLGGEFILTASNNDPYGTAMMAQHHAQDVIRAIETDRWAVRATNTGYSGVVDHHGRTLWRSQPHVYQIYQATIGRRQSLTPYVRWGDWLTPLMFVGLGLSWISLAIALRREHRAH